MSEEYESEEDEDIRKLFHNIECAAYKPADPYRPGQHLSPALICQPCKCGEFATEHRAIDAASDSQSKDKDMVTFSPSNSYGTIAFVSPAFPTRTFASVRLHFSISTLYAFLSIDKRNKHAYMGLLIHMTIQSSRIADYACHTNPYLVIRFLVSLSSTNVLNGVPVRYQRRRNATFYVSLFKLENFELGALEKHSFGCAS